MNEPEYISEDALRLEFRLIVPCCNSCHDDADDGYSDLCEVNVPQNRRATACCSVMTAMEKVMRETMKTFEPISLEVINGPDLPAYNQATQKLVLRVGDKTYQTTMALGDHNTTTDCVIDGLAALRYFVEASK